MKSASLKKNFAYQAFYEVLVLILPLITSPYIARVLGTDPLGIQSFTYTTANYFVLFAALGIRNYGNREIARNRDDKDRLNTTFSGILFLHLGVSSVVTAAYFIFVFFIAAKELRLYYLIQSIYMVGALLDVSWLFFGLEKFKMTVTRNAMIRLASVAAIFILVKKPSDLWLYSLLLALANLLGQLYLWLYVMRYVKVVRVPLHEIMRHFPQMAILFIPTVAISLYNYMDKIMVGSMSGNTQLAYYDNSEKIISITSNLIGSVGTVMLPRMSNIVVNNNWEKGKKYISNSMEAVLWLSCALSFGLAGIASVFAPVFWGREFTECAPLITLLVVVLPIKGFANVLRTQYLIPNKKDKEYTLSVCLGALVNVLMNLLLIPTLKAAGAAIGTIFAELTVCVVQSLFCKKKLPIWQYIQRGAVYVAIGAVMYLVVNGIGATAGKQTIHVMILQIIAGVCVYFGISAVFFYKTKNEFFIKIMSIVKAVLKMGGKSK